ncbi:MAG TPA: type III-A CRISPR-associated RAMP protein Csm5 [Chloroflexia bacterium]|nr:type III-A CRISPR-associated RAMP protein Csm5 [Chloroflexia bacterium]
MPPTDPPGPQPLKRTWEYTLEVLTPLHIGAGGDPLRKDTDFIATSKDVVVLDPERTFERIYEGALAAPPAPTPAPAAAAESTIAEQLKRLGLAAGPESPAVAPSGPTAGAVLARLAQGMTPSEALAAGWLIADDLRGAQSIVRYRLQPPPGVGTPLPDLEPPQILPLVKDNRQRPYVPGSSLKGALRTALAAQLFAGRREPLAAPEVLVRGRPNPKAADDQIEQEMFGHDPNHDLLRTVLVGDSGPATTAAGPAGPALAVSGTYSIRQDRLLFKPGFYVALEVLPAGAQVRGRLQLDLYPLRPELHAQLGFIRDAAWLATFPQLCNAHARALITPEIAFYRQYGLPQVATFYDHLLQRLDALAPGQCLLQISWGTGWLAKTLGPAMAGQEAFPEIRAQFGATMNRRPGAVYPKTRRLTLGGANYAQPGAPLGWVLLTVNEMA